MAIDLAGGPHEWQSVVLTGLPATGPTVLTFLGYQELSDNLLTAVTVTPTPAPLPGAGDLFAGGVAVLVEVFTDNKNRTVSDVRHLFGKHAGNLGESGCVGWIFVKMGVIEVEKSRISEDELLELALDLLST